MVKARKRCRWRQVPGGCRRLWIYFQVNTPFLKKSHFTSSSPRPDQVSVPSNGNKAEYFRRVEWPASDIHARNRCARKPRGTWFLRAWLSLYPWAKQLVCLWRLFHCEWAREYGNEYRCKFVGVGGRPGKNSCIFRYMVKLTAAKTLSIAIERQSQWLISVLTQPQRLEFHLSSDLAFTGLASMARIMHQNPSLTTALENSASQISPT